MFKLLAAYRPFLIAMNNIRHFLEKIIDYLRSRLNNNNNLAYYILMLVMLVVSVLGVNLFLELAEALSENQLHAFDSSIQQTLVSMRSEELTPTVRVITDLGDRYAYFAVIGILTLIFLQKRKGKLALQILFVSGLSAWATVVLKNTYQRQRPGIEHLVEIGGLSFPSGHALSAMAFYSFCIYLIWRYMRWPAWRIVLTLMCGLLIVAIGASRVYLGVHYPSDVIAGFVAGLIWSSFCILLFNLISLWRRRRENKKLNYD